MNNPEALTLSVIIATVEYNIRMAGGNIRPSQALILARTIDELRAEEEHYQSTIQKEHKQT